MTLADQLNSFRKNARWYAAHWIVTSTRHPQEHWVISERLVKWRQQAAGCREELQALALSILTDFERERIAAERPTRPWIMPSGRAAGLGAEEVELSTSEWASGRAGEAVDAGNAPARYTDTLAPSRKLETEPTSTGCAGSAPKRQQPQKNRYGKRRLVSRQAKRAA